MKPHKTSGLIIITVLIVILSYSVVLQPYGVPSINSVEEAHNITPENSYILVNGDGTYSIFYQGEYFMDIPEDSLDFPPHSLLPKKHE